MTTPDPALMALALEGAVGISINKGRSVVIDFEKPGEGFALYNLLSAAILITTAEPKEPPNVR